MFQTKKTNFCWIYFSELHYKVVNYYCNYSNLAKVTTSTGKLWSVLIASELVKNKVFSLYDSLKMNTVKNF